MRLKNSRSGYGLVSIVFHWLAAIGVVAMFAIGLNAEWATEAGDRARGDALMSVHIALGATLVLLFAGRILSHYVQERPDRPPQSKPLNLISGLTHHGLLLALAILIISGPATVWSTGSPIHVWGLFDIPSPFAERSEAAHEISETLHAIGRYMLWALVPLHLLGVGKARFHRS